MIVGLQGVQGCGKSHAAAMLGPAWEHLSLDDFYHAGLDTTRGPPGTHDVEWLERVLDGWRRGERPTVPVFNKTLRKGRGDRAGSRRLCPNAKHLLVEGWCLGFKPRHDRDLEVKRYETAILPHLDLLVVLHPPSLDIVYDWRRESETVLDEAAIDAFVQEYMPYYRAYLPDLHADESLVHLYLDESRNVYADEECTQPMLPLHELISSLH